MPQPAHNRAYLAVCIRDPRNELIPAECENLTGGTPDRYGVARCHTVDRVPYACYIRSGLRLIAEAKTLEALIDRVSQTEFEPEAFRVELFRLSKQVKIDRWDAMRRVADAIPYHPDIHSPKHRYLILVRDGWYCLGEILTEQTHDYRRHDDKPWRTSSSLPSQLARALVNLVVPGAKTILDPCCGAGSVLLEACYLGVEAHGADLNRRMVGMSRKNLEHFGYEAAVTNADARAWDVTADALITDLPYGHKLKFSESDIHQIMDRSIQSAPLALFVAGKDLSAWLYEAGYSEVTLFHVPKQTGFVRYVHRATRP